MSKYSDEDINSYESFLLKLRIVTNFNFNNASGIKSYYNEINKSYDNEILKLHQHLKICKNDKEKDLYTKKINKLEDKLNDVTENIELLIDYLIYYDKLKNDL
jgi:hypothetical protein